MLLSYVRRGQYIRVSRPPAAGARRGELIAVIDLRALKVRFVDGTAVLPEEASEIEEAALELRSTDPEKRAATTGYSDATAASLKYYLEKATELDKQLIDGTVRGAARTLRKTLPPRPKAPEADRSAISPIDPDVVAKALYRALGENAKGKVKGVPGEARRTEIRGFWDLRDVARQILSQA